MHTFNELGKHGRYTFLNQLLKQQHGLFLTQVQAELLLHFEHPVVGTRPTHKQECVG